MAARKAKGYRVIGAAAVVRSGKVERYLYKGASFTADTIDEDWAEHLLKTKLIESIDLEATADEK